MQTKSAPTLKHWLILILLGLIWGSSYILIKHALITFDQDQVATMRITLAMICYIPILLWNWRKIVWSKVKYVFVVSMVGNAIPFFLFPIAQHHISSSVTGVLSSLTPLFTLLWGIIFFHTRFQWLKVIGVLIGLLGAATLVFAKSEGNIGGTENIWGILVIIACGFYGISTNVVQTFLQDFPSLLISSMAFTIIGIPASIYLMNTDVFSKMATQPHAMESFRAMCLLAFFGTALANILFFKLIQETSAMFGSMVSYIMPVSALVWGFLEHEYIGIWHFVGLGLILSGIYAISKQYEDPKIEESAK